MKSSDINIPKGVEILAHLLKQNGHYLYVVGGYIRNTLMNGSIDESTDIDICGDCLPKDFVNIVLSDNNMSIKTTNYPLGTIKLFSYGTELEYTCFRKESYRGDGYHTPNDVVFTKDIYEDALRRDFTVNSIYFDIINNEFYDPFDGIGDINRKVLRCKRDSKDVFSEDALRLLRLCRFAGRTGFMPDEVTFEGAKSLSHQIQNISKERIGQEFNKILLSKYIETACDVFFDIGINEYIAHDVKKADFVMLKDAPYNKLVRWSIFVHSKTADTAIKYIINLCLGKNFANAVSTILIAVQNIKPQISSDKVMLTLAKLGEQTSCDLVEVVKIIDTDNYDMLLAVYNDMLENNRFIDFNNMAIDGIEIMNLLDINAKEIPLYKDAIFSYIVKNPEKNTKSDIKEYLSTLKS